MARFLSSAMISLCCCALAAASCSSDGESNGSGSGGSGGGGGGDAPDASTDDGGGATGGGGSGGSGGGPGIVDVECGDPPVTCPRNFGAVRSCCTESGNECGLRTLDVDACVLPNAVGSLDDSCPDFEPQGGGSWQGCCTEDNQCGALDPDGQLGCVGNETLGAAGQTCTFDPTNDCTEVFEITCDGPEDCPGAQVCCVRRCEGPCSESPPTYDFTGCFDSCVEATGDSGINGEYRELCHTTDTCLNPDRPTCGVSTSTLKPWLHRCNVTTENFDPTRNAEAGKLNCGTNVCDVGEKCCVREPHEPQCIPEEWDCTCNPSAPAPPDAGADASQGGDAGADSGGGSSDAAIDTSSSDAASD